MTVREVGKGIVIDKLATYRIGFINCICEEMEDQTELDAENMDDLEQLYREFCEENALLSNTVIYIERIGKGNEYT